MLIRSVWFSPNVPLCIMEHLHLGLICLKEIVPEVLWYVQLYLCTLSLQSLTFAQKIVETNGSSNVVLF